MCGIAGTIDRIAERSAKISAAPPNGVVTVSQDFRMAVET
jgi:preprotein translocase subunit YajC